MEDMADAVEEPKGESTTEAVRQDCPSETSTEVDILAANLTHKETELQSLKLKVRSREADLRKRLREEMERKKQRMREISGGQHKNAEQIDSLQHAIDESNARVSSLQHELTAIKKKDLNEKEQAETYLTNFLKNYLKESVDLLKSLQMHVEQAEQEKAELKEELEEVQRQWRISIEQSMGRRSRRGTTTTMPTMKMISMTMRRWRKCGKKSLG